jgi:hypothetical protein
VARLGQQHAQHHLALGDELALSADQIRLADIAIGGDARIVRIVDGDDRRQRLVSLKRRT